MNIKSFLWCIVGGGVPATVVLFFWLSKVMDNIAVFAAGYLFIYLPVVVVTALASHKLIETITEEKKRGQSVGLRIAGESKQSP